MADIIRISFTEFASKTGVLDLFSSYQTEGLYLLLLLGISACLFGFWVYRADFSVLLFFSIAYICTILMKDSVGWGAIVTCFSVVGIALSAMALYWHKVDGFVWCVLLGAGMGWLLVPNIWIAVIGAVLGGILFLLFPVIAICAAMAVGGSILFVDVMFELLALEFHGMVTIGLVILLAVIGMSLQLFISRKQKNFKKVMPDKLRLWMERRKRQNAECV